MTHGSLRDFALSGLFVALFCSTALAQVIPDNTPPAGFVALFNGKDLTGWRGLVGTPVTRAKMSPEELAAEQKAANADVFQHWSVQDGVIAFDGKHEKGKARNLCTVKDYQDFELYVDWKIEPKADTGIYLRGSPQVNIWDPAAGGENAVGSGGLYNNEKPENARVPLLKADKPAGEWNTFFIRLVGDRVTVILNGQTVVNKTVLENYWDRTQPIYPTGAIELQDHGSKVYFKNIYLYDLSHPATHASANRNEDTSRCSSNNCTGSCRRFGRRWRAITRP